MKPIRLEIQSFGSYDKKTVIDFTIPNQNLFLITGDTGAGKTTIYDAICFALYGNSSSEDNKKDGMILQSQFSDIKTEPYVLFVFEENGQEYTVKRIPTHLRAALKGASKEVKQNGSVTLTMPDGSAYPEKEVNAKLEEIIGLTKSQFMQIAMIAQGEFMKSLRASTKEKQAIFSKLFKTEIFKKIQDEFTRREKISQAELSKIKTEINAYISQIIIPENYEGADELQDLIDKNLHNKNFSLPEVEKLVELLSNLLEYINKDNEVAVKAYNESYNVHGAKRDAYQIAVSDDALFKELDAAKQELELCEENKATIDDKRILVKQIKLAYEASSLYSRFDDADKQLKNLSEALVQEKDKLPNLVDKNNALVEQNKTSQEQFEAATKLYSEANTRYNNAEKLFKKIEDNECELKQAEAAVNEIIVNSDKLKKAFEAIDKQETEYKEEQVKLQNVELEFSDVKNRHEAITRLLDNFNQLESAKSDIDNQLNKLETTQANYIKATEQYKTVNAKYEAERDMFFNAQAGILASKLIAGNPCPVCGSTNHPAPHIEFDLPENITREYLEEQSKKVSECQAAQESISKEAAMLAEFIDKQKEEYIKQADNFIEASTKNGFERSNVSVADMEDVYTIRCIEIDTYKDRLDKAIADNKVLLSKKQDEVIRLGEVRKKLEDISVQRTKFESDIKDNDTKLLDAKLASEGLSKALKALIDSKDFDSKEAALENLNKEKKKYDDAKSTYEKLKKELEDANGLKTNCETLIHNYETEIPKQLEIVNKHKQSYDTFATQNNLEMDMWKAIIADYDKDTTELEKAIKNYEEMRTKAEAKIENNNKLLTGKTRPDLEQIAKDKDIAEEIFKAAALKKDNISKYLQINNSVYSSLEEKLEKRTKAVEEHSKIQYLTEHFCGKKTGARMDLETFVQRYYMERVLVAANIRFLEMSAGQYELRLKDLKEAGEGGNYGLDLMVYSNVTGKEREVRTLSGGESFMAALALALGMGDLIQANSAAINLDIMFIDEGFGSLDDYSRNQAVKVLKEMAGGTKLIGIISHVTELKQEIEDQLIVTKDDNGSHVKWVNS